MTHSPKKLASNTGCVHSFREIVRTAGARLCVTWILSATYPANQDVFLMQSPHSVSQCMLLFALLLWLTPQEMEPTFRQELSTHLDSDSMEVSLQLHPSHRQCAVQLRCKYNNNSNRRSSLADSVDSCNVSVSGSRLCFWSGSTAHGRNPGL